MHATRDARLDMVTAMLSDQPAQPEQLLDEKMRVWVGQGWRIESRLPGQVVMVTGRPVNHLLHLVLTICTAGLWGLVWLTRTGEQRQLFEISHSGKILSRPL